jgi:membrane protein
MMAAIADSLISRPQEWLWGTTGPEGLPLWRRCLVTVVRYAYVTVRDLVQGDLTLRASSLSYTTLLAFVPLLAVSFALFKAFNIHNQLEPALLQALAPLGVKAGEITTTIIGFVDNMKVGALGTLGVVMLLYTVVSVMQKIEQAFNCSWRITQQRSIRQRLSDYLSVLLVGPMLVFAAIGITGAATSSGVAQYLAGIEPFGTMLEWLSWLIPYLMIIGAFTFIYVFMPNTRVRVRSALVGAVVAGFLWQTTGWGFAKFVAGSTQYAAVYSAFAGLVLFVIWIYVAWLILLIGANIAFYHQHPEHLCLRRSEPRLSIREREALSLLIMKLIAEQQYSAQPAWTLQRLARRLLVPESLLQEALLPLEQAGLLVRSVDPEPQYVPGRPLDATSLREVVATVRAADDERIVSTQLPRHLEMQAVMEEYERAGHRVLGDHTVKQLVRDR